MAKIRLLALLLSTLMVGACSGENTRQVAGVLQSNNELPGLSAVAGSSLVGVSYTITPEKLVVNFESVLGTGQHVELPLPDGVMPVEQTWSGNEDTLSLMLAGDGNVQIGVAPLANYQGNLVTVSISLGQADKNNRRVSKAPTGDHNQLIDLTIEDQGDGTSRLEWTEMNRGDYDFNREVNIADLTPIAIHYNEHNFELDHSLTTFWVDGDRNGEVNLADITTIAINYRSTVQSYMVLAPDETQVLIDRSDSLDQDGLPPRYNVVIPGSVAGKWQVMPVSGEGESGISTEPVIVTPPDLLVDVNLTGIETFKLDGSVNPGLGAKPQLKSYLVELDPLRRLMPGEDPDMAEIGNAIETTPSSLKVYDLPSDRYLALLVLYIPTVDLVTGLPREPAVEIGLDIWEYDPVVTIVPIHVHNVEPNSQAVVDISVVPGEFDGYYSNITTSGLGLRSGLVKLDNADGVLWRDSNGNLDYGDEARMWDENRWGITQARLEQLGQIDEYANGVHTSFRLNATVDVINQGSGEIVLKDTMIDFDGPEPPLLIGEIVLSFSEYATFASKVFETDDESPIDPGIIEFGTELEIEGYKLVDDLGGLEAVYWGEHIVKIIR